MASTVYIPASSGGGFTPPTSISVKTASYTIPAGKYARIVAECDSGGIFTINAVNAVTTSAFVNIDASTANSVLYTVPIGFKASVSASTITAAATLTVNGNGNLGIGANAFSQVFEIGPNGTISLSGIGSTTAIQGLATPSNATHRQGEFYVPTGTVISGTGNWRAVVEEYTV